MQALPIEPAAFALSDRQRHRLDTSNMIIKSLAACGLRVFGAGECFARLDVMRLGGFRFLPPGVGARPVNMTVAVRGKERLLPGFHGSYAEQRLLRCLTGYVIEGRSINAAMLAQALMANGNRYFDQVEDNFTRVLNEFRFSRAFNKPVEIDRRTGAPK